MNGLQQTAKGIAAVFVTMNRREVAEKCLSALTSQTLRPERVVVANNASVDSTGLMLAKAEEDSGGWVVSLDLAENLGNAGGMRIALEKAFAEGCRAVWILDDDSWPEPDALERLLAAEVPEGAMRSCRVVDMATGALSWPVQIPEDGGWRLYEALDPLPEGDVIRIRRSWLGALVSRQIYEAVGPVEERLFLRGEDEDYPRRIERAGFPVFMITDSLLHHPQSGRLNRWEFGGRTVVMESGLAGDKLYYRLRNSWWIARRDHGLVKATAAALLCFLALMRWERPIMAWLPLWWEAACDAFRGRLGRRRTVGRSGD